MDISTTPPRSPLSLAHHASINSPTGIVPPATRLPRLQSPSKVTMFRGGSASEYHHQNLAHGDENHQEDAGGGSSLAVPAGANLKKRKEPDSELPAQGVATKRPATAMGASTLVNSNVTRPGLATSRSTSGSGSAPFIPSTSRKPITTVRSQSALTNATSTSTTSTTRALNSSTLGKSTMSRPTASRPGSSLSMSTMGGTGTRKPTSSSSLTTTSTTRPASRLAASTNTRPILPNPALSRSTSGGSTSSTANVRATSAIGSGMATVAQVQSQNGRLAVVEQAMSSMQELLKNDQEKIHHLSSSQANLQALLTSSQDNEREVRRNLSSAGEELALLRSKHAREIEDLERDMRKKDRERIELEDDLKSLKRDAEGLKEEVRELKSIISKQSIVELGLKSEIEAQKQTIVNLGNEVTACMGRESEAKADVAEMKQVVKDIEEELRKGETLRRKLFNQVQELKGNIRVFARVRPALGPEAGDVSALADMSFANLDNLVEPQELTVNMTRQSAENKTIREPNMFKFDKVFAPEAGQKEVFAEIRLLAQSVLDGYNVCIFAYGQTGSGKSWTMEGGPRSEDAGMIPRSIEMIFKEASALKERGWEYVMHGQYLEIYNETINDLLGGDESNGKKLEILHDAVQKKTSVTGAVVEPLSNASQVKSLLNRAGKRRAVASTLMNERSSRSHSVFQLKVAAKNTASGEVCEAVLNLVDLAGSEKMDKSGTAGDKDRMKETININKSLTALQTVISKLGEKGEGRHVGYRDSTLTHLLQYSLSGDSKTLMFCNLSPLAAHAQESLTTLRFATKVNGTVVGTAKRQLK